MLKSLSDINNEVMFTQHDLAESKSLYTNMMEKDAVKLRFKVLNSLFETYCLYEVEKGTDMDTVWSNVYSTIFNMCTDNTLTPHQGEEIKANLMKIFSMNTSYARFMYRRINTDTTPATESISVSTTPNTTLGAIDVILNDYGKYFDKVFVIRLKSGFM